MLRALSLAVVMLSMLEPTAAYASPCELSAPELKPIVRKEIRIPGDPGPGFREKYGKGGVVIFRVGTTASGQVGSIALVCATLTPAMIEAARRSLEHWKFPAGESLNGEVRMRVEYAD